MMSKIQYILLTLLSGGSGTYIMLHSDQDPYWLSRTIMCFTLVILFCFAWYHNRYVDNIRLIRVTADMLVNHSNETPETVKDRIEQAKTDETLSEAKRVEVINGLEQVLELFKLFNTMPTMEEITKRSNNNWYMVIILTLILLINASWLNDTFAMISTLILMVAYIVLQVRSIKLVRGKHDGKGKTSLWK